MPGIVWVGTNDGNLQVSRDGGTTWKNVVDNVKGVPDETFVSRVEPSHFDAGTCYVAFDGHRTERPQARTCSSRRTTAQTWTSIAVEPADGQRERDPRGSEEPQPPLPRHRVRDVHLVERRQGVAALHDRPADGAHRRHPRAPARQRPDHRHARAEHLDPRRHHGAPADDRPGRGGRRHAVRTAAGGGVEERHHAEHHRRRQQALPRREPGSRARRSATTSRARRQATSRSRSATSRAASSARWPARRTPG